MSVYLSRLLLSCDSKEVVRDMADVQRLHQRVMSAFADGHTEARLEQGVLFRLETSITPPVLWVQSRIVPDWAYLPRGYLYEDPFSGIAGHTTQSLDGLLAQLREGATYRFRLRANPTRCIDSKTSQDGTRRHGRHVPLRRDDSRMAWLARKAQTSGFELIGGEAGPDVAVREPQSTHGLRAGQRLTFEGVTFEGRLRVCDADLLRKGIAHGIGRGKAYGFGLLSLARAESTYE